MSRLNWIEKSANWTGYNNKFQLPREDSNLQPSSYSIPSVTKRSGLSYLHLHLRRGRVYSLYTFILRQAQDKSSTLFRNLARDCPIPIWCRSPPN